MGLILMYMDLNCVKPVRCIIQVLNASPLLCYKTNCHMKLVGMFIICCNLNCHMPGCSHLLLIVI